MTRRNWPSSQMTQLLAAVSGLVTLQTAATTTPPPVPPPMMPPVLPFRAFKPDAGQNTLPSSRRTSQHTTYQVHFEDDWTVYSSYIRRSRIYAAAQPKFYGTMFAPRKHEDAQY
ncbi:uncharacterized protein LOC126263570 [Schistocerca nitens]|uniref:uncharacterized protein LOC126263570 n=1 Tax=Schistocerca nitens TaxID=7011 RepID=UPI002117B15A|nr:uncharacterized protein LOC126263570 [Schistocerca nitens]